MTDKATQLQEAKALTDEELASVQKTLDEAKERGFFKTSSLLPAGMCVLTTQHGLLDTAFETLQEENRKVRQELTVALHQLSDAQECRRDAEGSRSRLEHEIHRLNRLRGDAEMARSDAERQYRELTQLKDAGVLPPSSPHTRSKSRRTNRSSPRSKHSRRMSVSRLVRNDSNGHISYACCHLTVAVVYSHSLTTS